jgi:hypothetical protein
MHECSLPAFDPLAANSCEAEAGAYAQALLNLEAAQNRADEAYADWYECLNGEPPPPSGDPLVAQHTFSILDR